MNTKTCSLFRSYSSSVQLKLFQYKTYNVGSRSLKKFIKLNEFKYFSFNLFSVLTKLSENLNFVEILLL